MDVEQEIATVTAMYAGTEFRVSWRLALSTTFFFAGIFFSGCGLLTATNEQISVMAARLPDNPIISEASSPALGKKINGPSVLRVPDWVENPLGKYYLYFGHHDGKFIRLAYADTIPGPWGI